VICLHDNSEQNAEKSSLQVELGQNECTSIAATGAWKALAVSSAETDRCSRKLPRQTDIS